MRIQVLPPLVPDEPESGGASIGMGLNLEFFNGNSYSPLYVYVLIGLTLVYRT